MAWLLDRTFLPSRTYYKAKDSDQLGSHARSISGAVQTMNFRAFHCVVRLLSRKLLESFALVPYPQATTSETISARL